MTDFGDPRLPSTFWSKVVIDTTAPVSRPELAPCWLWTAMLNQDGYGRIRFRKMGNWAPLAHRAIWELTTSIAWIVLTAAVVTIVLLIVKVVLIHTGRVNGRLSSYISDISWIVLLTALVAGIAALLYIY